MEVELLDKVIADLVGSCSTLQEALSVYDLDSDELDKDDIAYMDEEIFRCTLCDWWYEVEELSAKSEDENICTECEG